MDQFVLWGSFCALPLIALAPRKLKLNLSFIIVLCVASITSYWAYNAFMEGHFYLFLAELPVIGEVSVSIDALSAIFILIINLITTAGSFYAIGYLDDYKDKPTLSLNLISLNILHISMILVTCFQNLFAFLIVWELMAVASFLLVIFEYDKQENMKSAINYFVQMHLGGIFLMIAFMWFYKNTGRLTFEGIGEYLSTHNNIPFFLLLFAGFGMKAGFVPFHTWMPKTYSAAPPHVTAIMSGVMTKMGLYGIFRTISLIHDPYHETIGMIILVVSTLSALYGIINSLMQKDLKKALAYSSIENIGIIGMGIGAGLIGVGVRDYRLAFFGFTAAILHLVNHSLFKSLLFFSAGGVYKQVGSNNMELMGGLIKRMPITSILFMVGSVAICALPPFNGFISEFLLYNGFIDGMNATNIPVEIVLLLSLISLALIGGLAIYSFSRIFGLSFLGVARTKVIENTHEVNMIMLIPQFVLAILLLAGGVFPQFFFRLSSKVAGLYINDYNSYKKAPLDTLNQVSIAMVVFIVLFVLIYLIRHYFVKKNTEQYGPTWGCGYTAGNNRMQYTPSSYSEYIGLFADGIVKEKQKFESIPKTEIFPKNRNLETTNEDPIEESGLLKPLKWMRDLLNKFAILQTGRTAYYIMYAFVFLLVMFLLTFFDLLNK